MKLKRAEWLAIAITAAFLLLVAGIHIGHRSAGVPVTVETVETVERTEQTAAQVRTVPQDEPVNLNTASEEELQSLTGIGPKLAERIVAYRTENGPFERVEDITRVQGIAEKVFSENVGRMTVE